MRQFWPSDKQNCSPSGADPSDRFEGGGLLHNPQSLRPRNPLQSFPYRFPNLPSLQIMDPRHRTYICTRKPRDYQLLLLR